MAVLGRQCEYFTVLIFFSREFEREADEDGFAIVTKNNVNPKGMVTLFKRLQEEHSLEVPEFLSTHPITKDRIETIKTLIDSKKVYLRTKYKLEVNFWKNWKLKKCRFENNQRLFIINGAKHLEIFIDKQFYSLYFDVFHLQNQWLKGCYNLNSLLNRSVTCWNTKNISIVM